MGRKDKERTIEEAWANPLTLDQVLAEMSDERRKKIEARVQERIKEERKKSKSKPVSKKGS